MLMFSSLKFASIGAQVLHKGHSEEKYQLFKNCPIQLGRARRAILFWLCITRFFDNVHDGLTSVLCVSNPNAKRKSPNHRFLLLLPLLKRQ